MQKLGRFVVETHCHAQRHAARVKGEDVSYGDLARKMETAVPADEATDEERETKEENG